MGGLAGIVHWDNHPVEVADIESMLSRIRHRGPDGLHNVIQPGVAFGHARLVLNKKEQVYTGIHWTQDRNVGVVADARIYNRQELISALYLPPAASDAEIILSAFLRWEKNLLDRLDGDFAFAIYNRCKNELFAARDLFAAKPFFYVVLSGGLLFGSEPKQMLGFHFGVKPEPDPLEVAHHLTGSLRAGERTAWKKIRRLRPGFFLLATPGKFSQHPYWKPDLTAQPTFNSRREYVMEIRTRLTEAVAKRINVEVPVALELSGGYDSSSLNLIAGKLFLERRQECTQDLFSISATYNYAETDETSYIQAVRQKLPYPGEIFEASTDSSEVDLSAGLWRQDSPLAPLEAKLDQQIFEIIQVRGARVLINGIGGDDLFWEPSYCADLLKSGRITDIIGCGGDCHSGANLFAWFIDSLRQSAPSWIRTMYQALVQRKNTGRERNILSPALLHELLLDDQRNESYPVPEEFNHSQAEIFRWITDSKMLRTLEDMEISYAYQGIERRQPFYDRMLIELTLSIPWFIRIDHQGKIKSLLQNAVSDLLPESILIRNNKAIFDPYYIATLKNYLPSHKEMFILKSNEIEQYIDKDVALALFSESNLQEAYLWSQFRQIWTVSTLKQWLHDISQSYNNGE